MTYSGIIMLLDKFGNIIRARMYNDRTMRRHYLKQWRIEYGIKFLELSIQIAPNVDKMLVNEDGVNIRITTTKK